MICERYILLVQYLLKKKKGDDNDEYKYAKINERSNIVVINLTMILKLCRNCKKVIAHPATYCFECQKIVNVRKEELQKIRDKKYNQNRDSKYKTFYNSSDWYILKEKKLQDEQYRCEFKGCSKLAVDVHHIKPIQTPEGWELRLDYNNLEALCVEHHNYRHNRFQKRKKVN